MLCAKHVTGGIFLFLKVSFAEPLQIKKPRGKKIKPADLAHTPRLNLTRAVLLSGPQNGYFGKKKLFLVFGETRSEVFYAL